MNLGSDHISMPREPKSLPPNTSNIESRSELEETGSVSPPKLDNLKVTLATFAFSASSPVTDTRATSRLRKRRVFPEADESRESVNVEDVPSDTGTSTPKKKRRVRGYADPATYAHLQGLPDILADNLDILFCGINPGQKSATIGHHYAHHSNHLWDCLYQSGFTPTKLPAEEDHTLPERFALGLTNLVERPTAEQNELSSNEQAASVPDLLAKVARYRPRVVCFLGLGIAQTFQSQLIFKSTGPTKVKVKKSALGLQAYKMTYSSTESSASDISETLFYALPSPSARVVIPQKKGKIELFVKLKAFLNQLKEEDFRTDDLHTIVFPSPSMAAE